MFYIKKYLCFLCIFISVFSSFNIKLCLAEDDSTKILMLCSYSLDNYWEKSVIEGFKESMEENMQIKIEFMDSKLNHSQDYYESFLEWLNLKYKDMDLNYIVTIDDEAFNFVRKNLFIEDSFAYKKTVIFTGVNSYINLTNDEKSYITGMLEYQNNIYNINAILESNKDIKKIYLVIDKSIYTSGIKQNFAKSAESAVRDVEIEDITSNNLYKIDEEIKSIDSNNSAILICGEFYDEVDKKFLNTAQVMDYMKKLTRTPIYTNLKEYVEAGAIGGYVNDGNAVGNIAAQFLTRIVSEGQRVLVTPTYNTLNIPIFNFKAIREYKINPQTLPEGSIIINKGRFNFLVPRGAEAVIWIIFMGISFMVIILSIFSYKNGRKAYKNKLMLEESIKKDEMRTDLFLTMSHELRTPINIIINAANLLRSVIDQSSYNKEIIYRQIKYIKKNSNRLLKLVNNLIDVNKLDSNHMSSIFKNCNIVEVVEDAVQAVVDLAASYNIQVTFDTEEEEIIMAVDKSKIERIILNLLSNSIKFIGNGDYILVKVYRIEKMLFIEVEDNGKGMSEEMQKYAFDKFKRFDGENILKREQEGSGLGLFIVKQLVLIHSGDIKIESTRGIGTNFIISIPIVSVDENEALANVSDKNLEYMVQVELSDVTDGDK